VPVLPIIDLLILLGWSTLLVGFVLKAVYLTTSYRPTLLGLTPLDLLLAAGVFLIFALSLAARTWVKLNEPRLLAQRRAQRGRPALEEERRGNGEGAVPAIYEHARTDRPEPFGEAVGRQL
jgi:hypothetical protein